MAFSPRVTFNASTTSDSLLPSFTRYSRYVRRSLESSRDIFSNVRRNNATRARWKRWHERMVRYRLVKFELLVDKTINCTFHQMKQSRSFPIQGNQKYSANFSNGVTRIDRYNVSTRVARDFGFYLLYFYFFFFSFLYIYIYIHTHNNDIFIRFYSVRNLGNVQND